MDNMVESLNTSFLKNKIKKIFSKAKKRIVKPNQMKKATKSGKAFFGGTMTIEVGEMDFTVKGKKVKVFIVNRPEDFTDVLVSIDSNLPDINNQVSKHNILKYSLLRIIIREREPTEVELVFKTTNKKFLSVYTNFKNKKYKVKEIDIFDELVSADWVM